MAKTDDTPNSNNAILAGKLIGGAAMNGDQAYNNGANKEEDEPKRNSLDDLAGGAKKTSDLGKKAHDGFNKAKEPKNKNNGKSDHIGRKPDKTSNQPSSSDNSTQNPKPQDSSSQKKNQASNPDSYDMPKSPGHGGGGAGTPDSNAASGSAGTGAGGNIGAGGTVAESGGAVGTGATGTAELGAGMATGPVGVAAVVIAKGVEAGINALKDLGTDSTKDDKKSLGGIIVAVIAALFISCAAFISIFSLLLPGSVHRYVSDQAQNAERTGVVVNSNQNTVYSINAQNSPSWQPESAGAIGENRKMIDEAKDAGSSEFFKGSGDYDDGEDAGGSRSSSTGGTSGGSTSGGSSSGGSSSGGSTSGGSTSGGSSSGGSSSGGSSGGSGNGGGTGESGIINGEQSGDPEQEESSAAEEGDALADPEAYVAPEAIEDLMSDKGIGTYHPVEFMSDTGELLPINMMAKNRGEFKIPKPEAYYVPEGGRGYEWMRMDTNGNTYMYQGGETLTVISNHNPESQSRNKICVGAMEFYLMPAPEYDITFNINGSDSEEYARTVHVGSSFTLPDPKTVGGWAGDEVWRRYDEHREQYVYYERATTILVLDPDRNRRSLGTKVLGNELTFELVSRRAVNAEWEAEREENEE